MFSLQELLENTQLERFTCSTRKEKCKMITKEKNRTKIICAVVTAISAIVAGGSAFQLHNVQNISQTVNGNVIQILGETGSYVSAGTDLTDSTDELISAYRKVLDENSQYQANQSTLQG